MERWAIHVNRGSHRTPRWAWVASFIGPERFVYDFIVRTNLLDYSAKPMKWISLDRPDVWSATGGTAYDKGEFD